MVLDQVDIKVGEFDQVKNKDIVERVKDILNRR